MKVHDEFILIGTLTITQQVALQKFEGVLHV